MRVNNGLWVLCMVVFGSMMFAYFLLFFMLCQMLVGGVQHLLDCVAGRDLDSFDSCVGSLIHTNFKSHS